jgi:transglutaminase-like putative cysteine protease
MAEARKRGGDRSTWPMSAALFVALAVSAMSLGSLVRDVPWWFVSVGGALIVTVVMALTRLALRVRAWALLTGSLALLAVLSLFFAALPSIFGFIPTPGTFLEFNNLVANGIANIQGQKIPAIATPGILFLLTLGLGAIAILLDLITITARRPALSGLVLLIVVAIPTFIDPDLGDAFVFLLTGAAWLVIMHVDSPFFEPKLAAGIGSAALVTAVIAQLIVMPALPQREPQTADVGYSTGINPILTLGDNLRRNDPVAALTYTSTAVTDEYFTFSVLDEFGDEGWQPSAIDPDSSDDVASIGPVPGRIDEIASTEFTTSVTVGNIGGRWIPAQYAPTSITGLVGRWQFDPDTLGVRSQSSSMVGQEYVVESSLALPTELQMREADPAVPITINETIALPDDLPESIRQTALEVTADAETNFDKALALQDYFRNGDFEYSELAPVDEGFDGDDAQIIARFLVVKKGYCVHFSSSMAVMARSLGIPARVAVGFTPGTYAGNADGPSYLVTTDDLHAWPELFFTGIGWVRFEPTPGIGSTPAFAGQPSTNTNAPDPSNSPTPEPSSSPSLNPPRPTPTPTVSPSSGASPEEAAATSTLFTGVIIGGVVLLVLLPLLPALVRGLRRRSRFSRVRRRGDPFAAWREIVDTAVDLGYDVNSTGTPRELWVLLGTPASVEILLEALEASAYSVAPSTVSRLSLRNALEVIRRNASNPARARAVLLPASELRRWRARMV